jgi:chitin synthase
LRSHDVEEQNRNRIHDQEVEAGLDPCGLHDPYAPYRIPNDDLELSPWGNGYQEV